MESPREISVPLGTDDVTPEWLSTVLGCKIDPTTMVLTPGAQEDKGYLSNLLRIVCYEVGSKKQYNLIVKLIPLVEDMRQVVIAMNFDKVEVVAYQKVIPALIAQVAELNEYICPFIFGKFLESERDYSSVLVMEDLKPLNYCTFDFGNNNITELQLEQGINFLAMFHLAGSALEESEGKKIDELFPLLKGDVFRLISVFQSMMPGTYPCLLETLKASSTEVRDAYASLEQDMNEIIEKILLKAIECKNLIHGDPWCNNIMYNTDPSKSPKVIDWQTLSYMDVTIDLAIHITSCLPTAKITRGKVQELVKKYWELFDGLCKQRNLSHAQPRSWTQFETFFKTYGLAFAVIWFISSMVHVYTGNELERIVKVFDFFKEEGVLDFMSSL